MIVATFVIARAKEATLGQNAHAQAEIFRDMVGEQAQMLRGEMKHIRVLASKLTDTSALDAIHQLIEELEGRARALQVQAGDGHNP